MLKHLPMTLVLMSLATGAAAAEVAAPTDGARKTPAQAAIEALRSEPESSTKRRANCAQQITTSGTELNNRLAMAAEGQGPLNAIVQEQPVRCR